MVSVSPNAIKQIKRVREDDPEAGKFLRIRVKRGGCSGFSYKLDFDNETEEKDKIYEQEDGVKIVIDPQSLLYIAGMTLDYEGGLNGQGFVFSNPNAKKTCSCGSSFAV